MKNNIKAMYKIVIHRIIHQFKKEIIAVIDKVRVFLFYKSVCSKIHIAT